MAKTATKTRAKAVKTVQAKDTAETKPTTRAKRAAAKKQFAKADAAAAPTVDEIRAGLAARGY